MNLTPKWRQISSGLILISLCVAVLYLGLTYALGFAAMQHYTRMAQHQTQQQQALTAQLIHAKTTLLAFTGRQGVNSHTHPGHLPCPAPSPGAPPRVSCLQGNQFIGHWPELSQVAVNYLNPGLETLWNPAARRTQPTFQYAVSPQLLQPNTLGWSRWVNWTLPPLTLLWPDGQQTQAVAVAAFGLQPQGLSLTGSPVVAVQPPAMVLEVAELQAAVRAHQTQQAKHHIQQWQQALQQQMGLSQANPIAIQHTLQTTLQQSEHVLAQPNGQWHVRDPGCQCQCTRTRCTCQCAAHTNGTWVSAGACIGNNPNCQTFSTPQPTSQGSVRARCQSMSGAPCIMAGSSGLASAWPVSRFEPVAANNRACRPQAASWCPLINPMGNPSSSPPCTCDFSWPEIAKPVLAQYSLRIGANAALILEGHP